MEQGEITVVHCNTCVQTTAHTVVACNHSSTSEQTAAGFFLDTEHLHYLLVCMECKAAQLKSVRRTELLSDEFVECYFPAHPVRLLPLWVQELPIHIRVLLKETHIALANKHYWLAAMGTRSLIDMFAVERIGDIGGFKQKLEALEKQQILSAKDKLVVDIALEIGHDATHRSKQPSPGDCNRALDITENLLQRLVNETSASEIREARAKTPPF